MSLPGYASLITADSDTNAGGVGAYVSENFSATVLRKNLLQSKCEDLWLQIVDKFSQESFNLGIIYRHFKVMSMSLFWHQIKIFYKITKLRKTIFAVISTLMLTPQNAVIMPPLIFKCCQQWNLLVNRQTYPHHQNIANYFGSYNYKWHNKYYKFFYFLKWCS